MSTARVSVPKAPKPSPEVPVSESQPEASKPPPEVLRAFWAFWALWVLIPPLARASAASWLVSRSLEAAGNCASLALSADSSAMLRRAKVFRRSANAYRVLADLSVALVRHADGQAEAAGIDADIGPEPGPESLTNPTDAQGVTMVRAGRRVP